MAIYPGSFDPVTNGHISLMERACHLFDTLTIAVSKSAGKSTMFTFEERLKMVKQASAEKKMACEVKVIGFEGLLAELAQREKAVYLSSTIVKDVARHGGNVEDLVPKNVVKMFEQKEK